MAEIALATTLLSSLSSVTPTFLKELSKSGIEIHQGATIFYNSCEIEFAFHFNKSPVNSKMSSILKSLKKYLTNPMEFEDVIEIYGDGLSKNENLQELGIIEVNGTNAKVDFGKILNLQSDLIILKVRKKLNPAIQKHILSTHIDKTPEHENEFTSSNIEVTLDYGNLWHADFDQFNVRDIEFSFNLNIDLAAIANQLTTIQKRKILNAGKALAKGNKDAITFMKICSDNFLKFESDELLPDLIDCVSLDPTENFKIKNIIPKMQSAEIAGVSTPIVLPGSMKIFLECRLEGKDVTIKGKIIIDLKKFKKILKKIMDIIEKDTSKLKI